MPLAALALFRAALALAAFLQPPPATTPAPSPPMSTTTAPPAAPPSATANGPRGASATPVRTASPSRATSTLGAVTAGPPSAAAPALATATAVPSPAAATAVPSPAAASPIDDDGASTAAGSGPRAPAWLAPLGRLDPSVLAVIALLALAAALSTLVFAVITWLRARRMTRHYQSLMRGVEGQSLMRAVESYVERLNAVERRAGQVGEHGRATSTRLQSAIQHVHLERYSAVDASDNQQSFSLALLDAARNGVVLSAIYTRSGLRVYAKPIAGGQSSYALSPEERRAIGGE